MIKQLAAPKSDDAYTWMTYTAVKSLMLTSKAGRKCLLKAGSKWGYRMSSNGSLVRIITADLGPTFVFSYTEAQLKLIQNKSKPVKAKVAPKAHAKKVDLKPGFYMFSGSVKTADGKDSKVIHYLKNKPLKDKHTLWGMHTPTELVYDPQGFWKIVFNAKQGYHARLTEEQAAGVVAKSRFLGNDAAARSMMELYELCMSWHRGAVAEDRDALLKIDVPPKYRRLPAGALYRGVPITKAQYRALKSGATVTIKAKGTTSSWTSSAKTAKDFSDGEDYSLVIKRTDIKANMLVVNIPDVMFAVTGSKTDAMDFGDEGELVVRNSPQIWTVSPKNVYLLDSYVD